MASVSCGSAFVFCTTFCGNIYSWGSNGYGQLGLGDNTDRDTPTKLELKFEF